MTHPPDIDSYLTDVGSPISGNGPASPFWVTLDDFELPPHPSPAIQLSKRAWANLPGNFQSGLHREEIDVDDLLQRVPCPTTPRKRG
ncbi:hypothetical protein DSO57_1024075 [Entomophthora muscae]|uniref:Uncharacterized protein n=1 Tax=Entomophthora muscae TaxID=34485 RepID=A0ACC2RTV3_9FUNG|nr:hypothetical protein DSO57_1024075 [Entomophthora muscae]